MIKRIKIWTVLLIAIFVFSGTVQGYGTWHDPQSEYSQVLIELDQTIERLDAVVQKAITNRSAHPSFLKDLEELLESLRNTRYLLCQ